AEAQRQQAARQDAERAAAQKAAAERAAAQTAAQTTAPVAAPVAAAPAVRELRLVSAPSPRYPPEAFRAGTRGEVLMEVTVAPDGTVSDARVVHSQPTRVFDRAALTAVKRWRFEPPGTVMTTRRTIAFVPSNG
ncbi:MAG: energy transducer TonB, partial [Pseudoxanthomonas sp.]